MAEKGDSQIATHQKSTFVTVTAWIFIIFGGFSTLISLMQNIMIHFIFPQEEMNAAFSQPEVADQVPILVEFMFNNFNLFIFVFFLLTAFTFIASIALLKRKNWARLYFIGILSIGILWNIGGVVMQHFMFSSMAEMPVEAGGPPEFQTAMTVMRIATIVLALAGCALLAWMIKKFTSENIKAEFI